MFAVLRYSFLSLVLTSLFVGASAAQEILVAADADTMYIEPREDLPNSGNPTGWTARVYDLTQDDGKGDPDTGLNWQSGKHGVGFGDNDDATEIPDDDDTYGIYTRTDFTVADASLVGGMQVAVDFDDAYIMYINGTEVNRSETAAAVVDARWDTLGAYGGDPTGVLSAPISIDAHIPLLVDGLNVLAIHVFNNTTVSSDITMLAQLTVDIDGGGAGPPSGGSGGTATYLGTHTESAVQIDGALLVQDGVALGPGVVNYTGGLIVMSPLNFNAGSFFALPDNSNNPIQSTGAGSITAVFTALDFDGSPANGSKIGIYYDEVAPASDNQKFVTITPDGSGAFFAGLVSGSGDAGTTPVSLPITIVLTRSAGQMSATANGADLGSITVPGDTEALFARVFFENVSGREGVSASLSSIVVEGVGIPNVNLGPPQPTVSISRVGAVDEAFTSGTAEWTVSFSEAMANVTADDFAAALTGDAAADAPTIIAVGPSEFTVTAANVTGEVGTIRLNLNDETDIETVADATPIGGKVGPAYSIGIEMPAVGLLGLGLAAGIMAALGASAARRQKK